MSQGLFPLKNGVINTNEQVPLSYSPEKTEKPVPNLGEELSEPNHLDYLLLAQQIMYMPKIAAILPRTDPGDPRSKTEQVLYEQANFEGIQYGQSSFNAAQKKYLKAHGDAKGFDVDEAHFAFHEFKQETEYLEKRGWKRLPTSRGWTEPKYIEADYEYTSGCCGNKASESYPNGYFGAAFYLENDSQPLEIAIVHRGTDGNMKNLMSDLELALSKMPKDIVSEAAKYTQQIFCKKHFCNSKQCDFTINGKSVQRIVHVGHSLGGFIASTLVSLKQNAFKTNAVTFDCPGTRECLEAAGMYTAQCELGIVNYMNPPHIINTCNTAVGTVHQLADHICPDDERFERYDWTKSPSEKLLRNNTAYHDIQEFMIEHQETLDQALLVQGALFRYPAFKSGEWKKSAALKKVNALIDGLINMDDVIKDAEDAENQERMEVGQGGEKVKILF